MRKHLTIARSLTKLLEGQFSLFGFKFGLDPLIGLIPGIGDALSLVLSLYVVWIGIELKIPGQATRQMVGNVLIDFILGQVPILGDAADFIYRANSKNMAILEKFTHEPTTSDGEIIS